MGHVISKDGIVVDSKNIEAIMDWPTPKNIIDSRYCMGLVGYYSKFIEGLSKVAHLITSLKRKNVKFNWYEKCEASF